MSILIVTESYFGNTSMIAHAMAEGIAEALGTGHATITAASEADATLPAGVRTLIVAAPTHDFSLPSTRTREQARAKGAPNSAVRGVREWIETLQPVAGFPAVTIDTSTKARFTPGTASKAAYKALRTQGFTDATRGPSFYVAGVEGPLLGDELQRARNWGKDLALSLLG